MELNWKLWEVKYDYRGLEKDLEKGEWVDEDIDGVVKQVENIEEEMWYIGWKLNEEC